MTTKTKPKDSTRKSQPPIIHAEWTSAVLPYTWIDLCEEEPRDVLPSWPSSIGRVTCAVCIDILRKHGAK